MSVHVSIAGRSGSTSFSLAQLSSSKMPRGFSAALEDSSSFALSFEFVAKPEKARSAPQLLPEAIHSALKEVAGFAGCVVLSSDQEARLITVITFWTGNDSRKACYQNVRWVRALLASHMDRCLRVQTLLAHAALAPESAAESNDAENSLIMQEAAPAQENACVA